MHTTSERVEIVKHRVSILRRRKENRMFGILSALCMVLTVALVTTIGTVADTTGLGMVPGLTGSIMRFDSAGGYVLVGLLAFIVAVVVTVLCMRHKAKTDKINNDIWRKLK